MKTQQKLDKQFSCEFFPPKTEKGMEKLLATAEMLKHEMNPAFFSVTFGAGGSTRESTFEAVTKVQQCTGLEVAPHLSCISSSKPQLREILDSYKQQGIKRIVTLRGDRPNSDEVAQQSIEGSFSYAVQLVSFIRENYNDDFHLEVAAYPEMHPEAANATRDFENFKTKISAGANSAITQYFYNIDSYYYFIDSCEKAGIDIPIVPGIMPISSYPGLTRFSNVCGAEIPLWLRKKLESFGDDTQAVKDFGAEFVSRMCEKLLEMGAPGLHFYTLNQTEASLRIWNNIKP
ncbi:5,10-methylenetetrahydrofolate reductase [hydrothermal vent metagenome]|uniref:methylenetetrahydrofolate reductase (NADH) n=1 Tax=hydrothermal vent metagenome TaxID=652676 RepID=A0A3B0WUX2_9ZZZZ